VEESLAAVADRTLNTMAVANLVARGAVAWEGLLADARYDQARQRQEGMA